MSGKQNFVKRKKFAGLANNNWNLLFVENIHTLRTHEYRNQINHNQKMEMEKSDNKKKTRSESHAFVSSTLYIFIYAYNHAHKNCFNIAMEQYWNIFGNFCHCCCCLATIVGNPICI